MFKIRGQIFSKRESMIGSKEWRNEDRASSISSEENSKRRKLTANINSTFEGANCYGIQHIIYQIKALEV